MKNDKSLQDFIADQTNIPTAQITLESELKDELSLYDNDGSSGGAGASGSQ